MNLNAALEGYLAHLRAIGKSERTVYTYRKDSNQILAFFGHKLLADLSRLNIGKFLKSPELLQLPNGKGRAPHTVNKTRGFFKRFVLWCLEQGMISENPLPKELLERKAKSNNARDLS